MTKSTLNRRQAVIGVSAAAAAAAASTFPLPVMGTTSAEFARLRGVLAVRLVERRRALATWNALRDTQAFRDWGFALFQHHALFKACREAEWAAREAAEDLFVRKADTDAERNLQRLAIGVYERELGDTLRLARKHFAPETLA